MTKKILILARYDRLGASSRLRFFQYLSPLVSAGFTYTLRPLIDDKMLDGLYKKGSYNLVDLLRAYKNRISTLHMSGDFDLIWIEKEALPWLPSWLELYILQKTPFVLDYDDAVFHNYDLHRRFLVRFLLGKRIDKLMSKSSLITAGNKYLASRAQNSGAQNITITPTVIDLERYKLNTQNKAEDGIKRIVWIGSPSTSKYLNKIIEPLAELSQLFKFKLRIISSDPIELPGIDLEFVPWDEETEVASIMKCDVGIMPLNDSEWERGKCGYKLIQYMACGLPVVASPIGVNSEIVRMNKNGYLADTHDEWICYLGKLLGNTDLRHKMGQAGRKNVEEEYCVQKTAPKIIKLLNKIMNKN